MSIANLESMQLGKPDAWEELRSIKDRNNPFHPWHSQMEYELVEWLATSQLSQAAIDRFLKLNWVSNVLCSVMTLTVSPYIGDGRTNSIIQFCEGNVCKN